MLFEPKIRRSDGGFKEIVVSDNSSCDLAGLTARFTVT
jgi:hypothetical protein